MSVDLFDIIVKMKGLANSCRSTVKVTKSRIIYACFWTLYFNIKVKMKPNTEEQLFCYISWAHIYLPCLFRDEQIYQHIFNKYFFFKILFMRQREREAETQAEGEAGSMQGAWRGNWSRVSRITSWAVGGAKPLSQPGCPQQIFLINYWHIGNLLKLKNGS